MTLTVVDKLRELLDLATLLPALLTSYSSPTTTSDRNTGHSPSPLRLDITQILDHRRRSLLPADQRAELDAWAGDHQQGLLPDLDSWAVLTEAELLDQGHNPEQLPDQPTLASTISYLIRHDTWIHQQTWKDLYAAEVDWWWRRCRHLIGEGRPDYQPTCSCGWHIHPDHDHAGKLVGYRCNGCGNTTDHGKALQRLAAPLVTLRQAHKLTGTPLRTLRRWAAEGHLIPVETTPVRTYLLDDVRHATAARPKRGRPAS